MPIPRVQYETLKGVLCRQINLSFFLLILLFPKMPTMRKSYLIAYASKNLFSYSLLCNHDEDLKLKLGSPFLTLCFGEILMQTLKAMSSCTFSWWGCSLRRKNIQSYLPLQTPLLYDKRTIAFQMLYQHSDSYWTNLDSKWKGDEGFVGKVTLEWSNTPCSPELQGVEDAL